MAGVIDERFFRGELRATAQVLRDQFLFLVRAGFDALDVVKPADAEAFAATLGRYSVFYQPAGSGRPPAARPAALGALGGAVRRGRLLGNPWRCFTRSF